MIPFSLGQITGLLLFFAGLKILSRCNALERKERLKRKIQETMQMVRPNWQAREETKQSIRKPAYYAGMGTFMALLGMILFFVY